MSGQSELPQETEWPRYIDTVHGYRVYQARDGWHECYKASGHAAAGGPKKRPKKGAHNGTSIKRIVLPSKDYGEALKLLDAVVKRSKSE